MYDYLIVGAGLSGQFLLMRQPSVAKKVKVIDKRDPLVVISIVKKLKESMFISTVPTFSIPQTKGLGLCQPICWI